MSTESCQVCRRPFKQNTGRGARANYCGKNCREIQKFTTALANRMSRLHAELEREATADGVFDACRLPVKVRIALKALRGELWVIGNYANPFRVNDVARPYDLRMKGYAMANGWAVKGDIAWQLREGGYVRVYGRELIEAAKAATTDAE